MRSVTREEWIFPEERKSFPRVCFYSGIKLNGIRANGYLTLTIRERVDQITYCKYVLR